MIKKLTLNKNLIPEIIYLFIIFFLCYTASNKLVNIESFRINLIKTSLFSVDLAKYFSYVVIVLEAIIILILFFNKKIGLLLFSFTIAIFTVYISYLRFKGFYEVCGCGGILNGLRYKYHLAINLFLIISSLLSFFIFNSTQNEK